MLPARHDDDDDKYMKRRFIQTILSFLGSVTLKLLKMKGIIFFMIILK